MVVHNPNNWHWVEKNTLPWAQAYLSENLKAIKFDNSTYEIIIKSSKVTGDCDVSQRKGKVICIYDLLLELTLQIKDTEKKEVVLDDGILKITEFIHDEEKYEYIYEKLGDYKKLVEEDFLPVVLNTLGKFQQSLIDYHTPELQEVKE